MTDLITRYLEALSAIPVERDEAVHYIYQLPDGNLIKKSFFQDWSLPDFIGPAKPGTSVAYYLDDEKELVICLNESNVLQDYQLSDDEEWILGGLSDLGFVAAPGTELSITKHEDNLHLYCQDTSGEAIRELIFSDSSSGTATWGALGELSVASPIKDTSISAVTKAGRIHVFYVHLDRSIHQCIYEGNSWIDNTTGKLEDESLPARIAASVDNGCLNVFYKTETGEIVALEEEGKSRRKIGTVGVDGTFVSSAGGGGGDREERFMANVLNAQICAIM